MKIQIQIDVIWNIIMNEGHREEKSIIEQDHGTMNEEALWIGAGSGDQNSDDDNEISM